MIKRCTMILLLFVFSHYGFCENIHIQTINPMPGFEKVGGPAFGEKVTSYSGQGLVQYVSESRIMINSKMYFMNKACENQTATGQIRKACIVKYTLNKQAVINNLVLIVQLKNTGKVDRIDDDAVVINDHFYKLGLFITYHDISGYNTSHYNIKKGDFVGVTFNKENHVKSLWYLNGHYLY